MINVRHFSLCLLLLLGCEAEPAGSSNAQHKSSSGLANLVPPVTSPTSDPLPTSRAQIQMSFSPLVKKTAPAIVSIYALKVQKSPFQGDPFFEFFFGGAATLSNRVQRSLGSGTLIAPNGLIITNQHVVQNSEQIKVVLSDQREFDAKILVSDESTDLAILKISDGDELFPYLECADSDKAEVGDLVLAIGNPFGFSHTVTNGIVSGIGRTNLKKSQAFIQTDAAINQGNSGGALVSLEGKLLGVCTFIISRSGGSDSIGFAIPANSIRPVIEAVKTGGRVVRSWGGLQVQSLTPALAESLGLKRSTGVIVARVYPKGPGALAQVQEGDVITHLDDLPVHDEDAFHAYIASRVLNATVKLTLVPKGQKVAQYRSLVVMAPAELPDRDERMAPISSPLNGASVSNLSPAVAQELGLEWNFEGIVISKIAAGSSAERLGLAVGDRVVNINGEDITTTRHFTAVLGRTRGRALRMLVKRQGQTIMLTLS